MSRNSNKGFTLLELLIVITILAVLSSVVVIVLNPAELLKRARDSQRISDLSSIKTAISYYLVNTSSPKLSLNGDATDCSDGTAKRLFSYQSGINFSGWASTTVASQAVNGTGWIPVNLTDLTGGSPISKYPIDPVGQLGAAGGASSLYYVYTCNNANKSFEINANMESSYYKSGGVGDVESKDGGNIATIYEEGTAVDLLPSATSSPGYYANDN